MAYDGNGTWNPPAPEYPVIPGTTILAEDFNAIIAEIASALSSVLVRDGQAAMTGTFNMGNQAISNVASLARTGNFSITVTTGDSSLSAVNINQTASAAVTVTAATNFTVTATNAVAITGSTVTLAGTVALPATTSIGNVSAAELAYLDGVTSAIQSQFTNITGTLLPAKADIAGETYSGTHDFTGSTITAPTQVPSDDSTKVATTAFVQDVAMSAALPSQNASTAYKFPQSNGVSASWEYLPLDAINYSLGIV